MIKIKECKLFMKQCRKCKQLKLIKHFRNDKYTKDGKTSRCKYCIDHKYKNICPICGKEFYGSHKNQTFCSNACKGKSNEKQIKFNCEICGKECSLAQCFYNDSKHHYCSKECKDKGHSLFYSGENHPLWNRKEVKCDYCGNTFLRKQNEIGEHNFCSTKCMGKYRSENYVGENNPSWKQGNYYCDFCGKEFTLPQSILNNNNKTHFCSKECFSLYRSENIRGESHPSWNPNLTQEERELNDSRTSNREYKLWRKSVFNRDNYTCQISGQIGGELRCHHLNGYNWDTEHRLDINNGITLSKEIHDLFHSIYGKGNNTKEQFEEFKERYNNGEFKEVI